MSSRVLTLVLLVGIACGCVLLHPRLARVHLPGNEQGYEPVQPVAFSHRLHAGELQVSCLYCHYGAERSRHAGIPAASVCMNCHGFVTAPLGALRAEDEQARAEQRKPRRVVSPELRKLYDALALGEDLAPDPARKPAPIAWARVHNLPDFVYFDHRPHVHAAVACQQCHGPVETMDRVSQTQPLTMGWCVSCHRQATGTVQAGRTLSPSIDCATCHF